MNINITDEEMRDRISKAKNYTLLILKKAEKYGEPGADKLIWEHGRRNFQLRAEGVLAIVCPVRDGSEVAGIGIFNASPEETKKIYAEDPAVRAGVLSFEVHACSGFPGDSLPK